MIDYTNYQCPASGDWYADIAIVGDAPGGEDCLAKSGFSSKSGDLLWEILGGEGVSREECFVTHVYKNRPPGNDIEKVDPFTPEWLGMLQEELRQVEPCVVLALGQTALNALCNYDKNFNRINKEEMSVMNWRGSVIESTLIPGRKVLVSIHPKTIIKAWAWRSLLQVDCGKLKRESDFWEIRRKERTFYLFPSFKDSIDYLESITDPYTIDIEGINGEIACVGFGKSSTNAMNIPFVRQDLTPIWSETEELLLWKAIGKRLAAPVPIIGQNLCYDLFWLMLYGCKPFVDEIYDTMLMFGIRYPEMDKGLDMIGSIFSDMPFWKEDGKIWKGKRVSDEEYFTYNLRDCVGTYDGYEGLLVEMEEFKLPCGGSLLDFYKRITMRLIDCVLKPMLRGFKVDLKLQMDVYNKYQEMIKQKFIDFGVKSGNPDINPRSTKQLASYLFDTLKLPKQYNRKTKNLCVDDAALKKLGSMYVIPGLEELDDIRDYTKIASTYLDPKKLDTDARFRFSLNIGGTDSGRMSSSSCPLRTGGNGQNVRKGLCRSIYIPDDQMVWLEADESQAEVRIVAHIAPEPKLIELYSQGIDIHKFNASIAFDVDYKDVTKPQRFVAKQLVHAADYNVQAKTYAATVNKQAREVGIDLHYTVPLAETNLQKFHDYFTQIRGSYHPNIQKALLESPVLYNLFGRPHIFLDRYGPDMFRKAYNWGPQSGVADICNVGWIRFNERYPQYAVMIQIHDALMVQCRMFEVTRVKEALTECFDIELEANGIKFKVPIEFKITTTNWSEMHDA